MSQLLISEMIEIVEVKRTRGFRLYDVSFHGTPMQVQVTMRRMLDYYKVELGTNLRYTAGEWAFDNLFAYWSNFANATPSSVRFGFENEGKTALHMDGIASGFADGVHLVKDFLLRGDGLPFIQQCLLQLAKVRAAEARNLAAQSQLAGQIQAAMWGDLE